MNLLCTSRRLLAPFATQKDVQKLLYGKRENAVHTTSKAKPSAALLLTKVPEDKISASTKHSLAMQELSKDDIISVLKSNRAMKRLDRSLLFVDALKEAEFPLTAHHYSLLMAHANDQRDAARALQFWEAAVHDGKVSDKLHGTLLATYRNQGRWEDAMRHCATMWEDKRVVDPYALHAVLNACRRHGPWESGLEVFSKAVSNGTRPNNVVYLELLRIIEHAHTMPSRWKYALAILDALHGKVDVTAGHFNSVLATMGGPNMWKKGVELYDSMKEHSVQPSRDTLEQLLLLNPANVTHCIRCVAEAHALGMPVTDTMYRAVLSNLFRLQLDHEAAQFAEREYRRDVEDPGHASTTTLALSFALMDSLLAHPRPSDAVTLYESFEPKLGDAVGPATRTLGSLGQPSQRWLVQGRAAVIDHNVVLSPQMESLIHHYDSIFIPFSSIRLLVRRARQLGASTQGRFSRYAFLRLKRLLQGEEWRRVARVLPLSHQLQSHRYLVDGPTSPEALRLMRAEAALVAGPTLAQRLLASVTSDGGSGGGQLLAAGEGGDEPAGMLIRTGSAAADGDLPVLARRRAAGKLRPSQEPPLVAPEPYQLQEGSRVSSAERVLAVAVMLKSLNPDADVHVLSTNHAQLGVVSTWTAGQPHKPITAVKYPEELFSKAPPASVGGGGSNSTQRRADTGNALDGGARDTSGKGPLFIIPS